MTTQQINKLATPTAGKPYQIWQGDVHMWSHGKLIDAEHMAGRMGIERGGIKIVEVR